MFRFSLTHKNGTYGEFLCFKSKLKKKETEEGKCLKTAMI